MSGYGWLTQSAQIPKQSKALDINQNSMSDLKTILEQQKNKIKKKITKPQDKFELKNKGIELRNKNDKNSVYQLKQFKNTNLQKKVKLYDKLQEKGFNLQDSLVDFEGKKQDQQSSDDSYEQERQEFYNYSKEDLEIKLSIIKNQQRSFTDQDKQTQNINTLVTKSNSLFGKQIKEERQRLYWEQQQQQTMSQNNNKETTKSKVQQSYDKKLTQDEKNELETVISELNKEKKEKELIRMINKKKMAYEKKKEE